MDQLVRFAAAMFALSVGVERIIEILKNLGSTWSFGWWKKEASEESPAKRSASIQFAAAAIGGLLAWNIGPEHFLGTTGLTSDAKVLVAVLLGAMSSGGSAFWNSVISIVAAIKDTKEGAARVLSDQGPKREVSPIHPPAQTLTEAELFERVRITSEQPNPRPTAQMVERAVALLQDGDSPLSTLAEKEFAESEAKQLTAQVKTSFAVEGFRFADEAEEGLTNWSGDQSFPVSKVLPWPTRAATEVQDLSNLILEAVKAGKKLRGVGTLHSSSDVLKSSAETVVIQSPERGRLNALLEIQPGRDFLAVPNPGPRAEDRDAWVRLRGVAHIREVAVALEKIGYALGNQGGFSGQTLAGALSCSTHGSGARLGPLSDSVDGYDFIGPTGKVNRIQSGLCSLEKKDFEASYGDLAGEFVKEDSVLRSARVSLGEWGIIYAVIVRAVPFYRLGERRDLTTWEKEREGILALAGHVDLRHLELWINPYANVLNGRHSAVLVRRWRRDKETPLENAGYFDPAINIANSPRLQRFTAWCAYNFAPEIVGSILEDNLRKLQLSGERVANPDDVFDIGRANELPASSGEYVFPATRAVEAIDSFLKLLHDNAGRHRPHPGWVSLRFVKNTTSRMSMFHGQELCCTVELPLITGGTDRWHAHIEESLASYQALCLQLGGRVHWAQTWKMNESELGAYLADEYPEFSTWRDHQRKYGTATFNNGCLPR